MDELLKEIKTLLKTWEREEKRMDEKIAFLREKGFNVEKHYAINVRTQIERRRFVLEGVVRNAYHRLEIKV